jgi:hypothetical protein
VKKNPPSMREVTAAQEALRNKIRERAKAVGNEPSYEEDRAWKSKHPSPSERYAREVRKVEATLQAKADEILLAGRMGQITSEEFYAKVKAF